MEADGIKGRKSGIRLRKNVISFMKAELKSFIINCVEIKSSGETVVFLDALGQNHNHRFVALSQCVEPHDRSIHLYIFQASV